jgi:hypothetical protein
MRGRLNKDMLTAVQKSFDSNIGIEVKMILVPEDYHRAIQRDSEFLEILDANGIEDWVSYDECVTEHDKNIAESETDGEEYAYGNRFQA